MRRRVVAMMAIALAGPATAFAAEPPAPVMERAAPERPNIVFLAAVDGLIPPDSSEANAFRAGVREAFEPDFYLTEAAPGGTPRVSPVLSNRFRLVQGDPFGDEWQVRVTLSGWFHEEGGALTVIGWIRPTRGATEGVRPDSARTGETSSTGNREPGSGYGLPDSLARVAISVQVHPPEAVPSRESSSVVFEGLSFDVAVEPRAAWFAQAGRAAGLLAVETLHRRSGDLENDTRLRVPHTVRQHIPHTPR